MPLTTAQTDWLSNDFDVGNASHKSALASNIGSGGISVGDTTGYFNSSGLLNDGQSWTDDSVYNYFNDSNLNNTTGWQAPQTSGGLLTPAATPATASEPYSDWMTGLTRQEALNKAKLEGYTAQQIADSTSANYSNYSGGTQGITDIVGSLDHDFGGASGLLRELNTGLNADGIRQYDSNGHNQEEMNWLSNTFNAGSLEDIDALMSFGYTDEHLRGMFSASNMAIPAWLDNYNIAPSSVEYTSYAPAATQDIMTVSADAGNWEAAQASSSSYDAVMQDAAETYTPEILSEHLTRLLDENSDYMKDAKTRAWQAHNSLGTLNSSMSIGSGNLAALRAAESVATGDVNAINGANQFNANAKNSVSMNNARYLNQVNKDRADSQNRASLENANATNKSRSESASQNLAAQQSNANAINSANRDAAHATNAANLYAANAANNQADFNAAADYQARADTLKQLNLEIAQDLSARRIELDRLRESNASALDIYHAEKANEQYNVSVGLDLFNNALALGIYADTGDAVADDKRIAGYWQQISEIAPDAGRPIIEAAIDEAVLAVI